MEKTLTVSSLLIKDGYAAPKLDVKAVAILISILVPIINFIMMRILLRD